MKPSLPSQSRPRSHPKSRSKFRPPAQSPVRPGQASRNSSHRTQATEALTVTVVNTSLAAIALAAFAQLVPYQQSQQQKLETLQQEVSQAQARVQKLEATYRHNSNPQSKIEIVKEENNLIGTNQRRVVWIAPPASQQPKPQPQTP